MTSLQVTWVPLNDTQRRDRVSAFFPSIPELVEAKDQLVELRRRGMQVDAFVTFGFGGIRPVDGAPLDLIAVWSLADLLAAGVNIKWAIHLSAPRFVKSGDPDYRDRPMSLGSFQIESGRVAFVQRMSTNSDYMIRLQPKEAHSFSVFFSKELLAERPGKGDEVEVAYIINYSGTGLYLEYPPAEIFFEGLGLRIVEPNSAGQKLEEVDGRDLALRVLEEYAPESTDLITADRKSEWIGATRYQIIKRLQSLGVYLDLDDESFIYKIVSQKADTIETEIKESLKNGFAGRLAFDLRKLTAMAKDRLRR